MNLKQFLELVTSKASEIKMMTNRIICYLNTMNIFRFAKKHSQFQLFQMQQIFIYTKN